jgi:hypothetical protein
MCCLISGAAVKLGSAALELHRFEAVRWLAPLEDIFVDLVRFSVAVFICVGIYFCCYVLFWLR